MNKFLLMPNILKSSSQELTKDIVTWLTNHQYEVYITEDVGDLYDLQRYSCNQEEAILKADCAIVLGGDGTILHAARDLAAYDLPILGVNLGHLGFLAEVDETDIYSTLDDLCSGRYSIEDRMMLQTTIIDDNNQVNNIGLALNDVVVSRASSRMGGYSVFVNDELVNHYFADGIIVSTPTGSTAYNLSAGGPILVPSKEMIVITPICPHSLTARSIVISSDDQVRINFKQNRRPHDKDLQVTIDGQQVIGITNDTELVIEQSKVYTHLVKLNSVNFYSLLRKKLGSN
ncbi:MAG: NAD(+) kinase [Firmicutes bacterium HGW-Firmicutes-1]|jgi:NAD+ kinase|nr:MAG: NAD(+) kinase [Firmicutes bacterium HGW-Firmicutes-1]